MVRDIFEEMIAHRSTLRLALVHRYAWFIHETEIDRLASIRKDGLRPYAVSGAPAELPSSLALMTCLHPMGSKLSPHSSQAGPKIEFAIPAAALPQNVGLDWSYEWRRLIIPQWANVAMEPFASFSARVIDDFGSVGVYEIIPPSSLLIRRKSDSRNDPSKWSPLLTTNDREIHVAKEELYPGTQVVKSISSD